MYTSLFRDRSTGPFTRPIAHAFMEVIAAICTFALGRQSTCHPPYGKSQGIILLAFASLGHALEPRLLDDPLVVSLARRRGKTPAPVLLAWGILRGSAVLTGSVMPARIRENFDVTALPESAIEEMNERLETRYRFNSVADGENRDLLRHPKAVDRYG